MKINVYVPCVQFLFGLSVTVEVTVLPSVTTDGDMAQEEFFGLPEQLNVTDPVSPPMGVSVTVYTAAWPEDIVSELGLAVIEKSPTFTCTDAVVELPTKFESPA